MINVLKRFGEYVVHEDGAIAVEYVFLLLFVTIVALVGIKTFGNSVNDKLGSNNNSVTNAIN